MKCGTNRFNVMVGGGGEGATEAEAIAAADKNVRGRLRRQIKRLNEFFNAPCPPDCPNQTIADGPYVHRFPYFVRVNPRTGRYHATVVWILQGEIECK